MNPLEIGWALLSIYLNDSLEKASSLSVNLAQSVLALSTSLVLPLLGTVPGKVKY